MEHNEHIESVILGLCRKRGPGKTICPSEVARNLFQSDWRPRMEEVRIEARRLANRGDIIITQGPNVLDPAKSFRGPIRLRLAVQ